MGDRDTFARLGRLRLRDIHWRSLPSCDTSARLVASSATAKVVEWLTLEPGTPYISKGLPNELVERLIATYQHTCKSDHASKRQRLDAQGRSLAIDEWTHDDVPLYTMLNWIAASGWELKTSSVGGTVYGSADCVEHYVFVNASSQAGTTALDAIRRIVAMNNAQ